VYRYWKGFLINTRQALHTLLYYNFLLP
jgi:hypothetical protein